MFIKQVEIPSIVLGAVEETKKCTTVSAFALLSRSAQCSWNNLSISSANTGKLTLGQEIYQLQGILGLIHPFSQHLLNM